MNQQSTDIILVNPPTRIQTRNIPFSILSLAAYLDDRGKKSKILDIKYPDVSKLNPQEIEDLMVKQLFSDCVPVIGFTCLTAEFDCVYGMAKRLREKGYKGILIAGGHHPTFCPNDFLEEGVFDYVVLGEGEVTLHELLSAIENKTEIEEIDGLAFNKNGILHKTKPRLLLENLSFLSRSLYRFMDLNYYLEPRTDLIRHVLISGIGVQTTRGCPFNCTFCGNNSLWGANRGIHRIRSRPAKDVINDIIYLKNNFKIDGFALEDDMFTLNDQKVGEFCDLLKKENLGLVWGCQSHVNTFTEFMAEKMRDAGCIQVEFGVESGSQRVLKEMKKGSSIEQIKSAFKICKKYDLRTLANFLINTPTEDESDLKATFSLADEIKATKYAFGVTLPLLGTELYDKYVYPRLKKNEYKFNGERRAYQEIIDPRFRLAKHKKNMGWLYIKVRLKYMLFSEYFDSLIWFFQKYRFYKKSDKFKLYRYQLFAILFTKSFGLFCRFIERISLKLTLVKEGNKKCKK